MSVTFPKLAVAACLLAIAAPVLAQDDAAPDIRIISAGSAAFDADLDFMLGLTTDDEQKQIPVIKDYLSVFLLGIDPEKPIRFDLIVRDNAVLQRPSFPIADMGDFLINLDGFGIDARRRGATRYELSDAFIGHMLVHKRSGYVSIAEDRADIPQTFDPTKGVLELLEPGHDVVAEMTNSEKGIDERRKSFDSVRKELMAAVKPMEEEALEDFNARKVLTEQQINELERFFVEAKRVHVGWTTDQEKKTGTGELTLETITGTDLAKSIALLGAKPSYFSGVAMSDDPVLGLRLNHPLDEFRIAQSVAAFDVLKERAIAHIDASEKLDDAQKAAGRTMNEQLFAMLTDGVKAGLLDVYIDLQQTEGGKYQLLGGFQSPSAAKLAEVLKVLPDAKLAKSVELDIEKIGEASVHKVHVLDDDKVIGEEFGDDRFVVIVTTPEAVWFAAGDKALERLKSAMESKPTADGVETFMDLKMRVGPWVQLRDRTAEDADSENEDDGKFRALALTALEPGDDRVTATLSRDGENVAGKMSVELGLFRLVGKLIAEFSKENLEE